METCAVKKKAQRVFAKTLELTYPDIPGRTGEAGPRLAFFFVRAIFFGGGGGNKRFMYFFCFSLQNSRAGKKPSASPPQKENRKTETPKMRAGESVVVCGAGADRAQLEEPFAWPEHAVVWVSVGCGHVCSPIYLPVGPHDATAEERESVARAYVRLVGVGATWREVEREVTCVSSWLRLVERAARVPCALVVACGGARVTAVPIFRVTWSARAVTVVGEGLRRSVRRNGPVDVTAHRVLWECGRTRESLEDSFRVVHGERRTVYLHPHQRCAVCDARVVSDCRIYLTARCGLSPCGGLPPTPHNPAQLENAEWLPQLMVCYACPVRSFRLWRTFRFTIDTAGEAAGEAGEVGEVGDAEEATLVGESAHESVWHATARVVATLAMALGGIQRGPGGPSGLTSPGGPSGPTRPTGPKTEFAAAMATALCDMKLLEIVAKRMLPPTPKVGNCTRVLSVLVETRQH